MWSMETIQNLATKTEIVSAESAGYHAAFEYFRESDKWAALWAKPLDIDPSLGFGPISAAKCRGIKRAKEAWINQSSNFLTIDDSTFELSLFSSTPPKECDFNSDALLARAQILRSNVSAICYVKINAEWRPVGLVDGSTDEAFAIRYKSGGYLSGVWVWVE